MDYDTVTFIKTSKGKKKLLFKSYAYVFKNRKKCESVVWRCVESRCLGRVLQFLDTYEESQPHNCFRESATARRVEVAKHRMKERAFENSAEPPSVIVDDILKDFPSNISTVLPCEDHMKRSIRQWKRKAANLLKEPDTSNDITIPPHLQKLEGGETFLLDDIQGSHGRILIFSTESNLKFLTEECDSVIMDGTFDAAQKQFYQLYVIHGHTSSGLSVPRIYALLPNKRTETYKELLQAIKKKSSSMETMTVILDFEQAVIKAVRSVFPSSTIRACIFHLQQSLWRNTPAALKRRYQEDGNVEIAVRSLAALSFLPPSDVRSGFQLLKLSQRDEIPELMEMYDYFEMNYIGTDTCAATFPVHLWNSNDRVKQGLPRTSNNAEAFHRKLKVKTAQHPSFWVFLDLIKKEQRSTDRKIAGSIVCSQGPTKKKYWKLNVQLQKLVQRYNSELSEQNKVRFITACAHSLASFTNKRDKKSESSDSTVPTLFPNVEAVLEQME